MWNVIKKKTVDTLTLHPLQPSNHMCCAHISFSSPLFNFPLNYFLRGLLCQFVQFSLSTFLFYFIKLCTISERAVVPSVSTFITSSPYVRVNPIWTEFHDLMNFITHLYFSILSRIHSNSIIQTRNFLLFNDV